MKLGIVGTKRGMSRKFLEDGSSVPVTLIEVLPNRVTQLKTLESDGYQAVQVTTGEKLASRVNKPTKGHFSKANTGLGKGLWEFRLDSSDLINGDSLDKVSLGAEITLDIFSKGQKVDVSGTSLGKGFAGAIKRHNFSMQDATHGNSISHRALGSTGQCQFPGKVFKGKKMAGQMGNVTRSVQNLEIIDVDAENNLLVVKGAIPGFTSGTVLIKPAVKVRGNK